MPHSTAPRPRQRWARRCRQRRWRAVSGVSRKRADQPRRRADPQRRLRHVAGVRPARRGRRGDRLCACRRAVGARPAARGEQRCGGGGRPFRRCRGAAARHQRAALFRRQSARRDRVSCAHRAAGRHRRLCARQGSAGRPGDGLDRRRVAGGPDHARRWDPRGRPAAAGAAERRRGGGAEWPAGDRQLWHRRTLRLRPCHRARGLARRGR